MRRRAGWAVLGGVVVALGCGPGFQAIYEGDARFEHCYALDENPSASMTAKGECWRDWMDHYTYGQTRDRVAYAAARTRAMSRIHDLPTDEALMGAAPGEIPHSGITAPAPTSAFAPPPKTLDLDAGGGPGGNGPAAGSSDMPTATWMTNLPPPPPPPGSGAAGGHDAAPGGQAAAPGSRPGAGSGAGAGAGAGTGAAAGTGSRSGPGPGGARPPGAACAEDCVTAWDHCRAASCGDGGACDKCDRGYKGCLRGCAAK